MKLTSVTGYRINRKAFLVLAPFFLEDAGYRPPPSCAAEGSASRRVETSASCSGTWTKHTSDPPPRIPSAGKRGRRAPTNGASPERTRRSRSRARRRHSHQFNLGFPQKLFERRDRSFHSAQQTRLFEAWTLLAQSLPSTCLGSQMRSDIHARFGDSRALHNKRFNLTPDSNMASDSIPC